MFDSRTDKENQPFPGCTLFAWILGAVTFYICAFNVGSSLSNNHQIVLATLLVILFGALNLNIRGGVRRLWVFFGGLPIAWISISNGVASMEGIEPARWSRVLDLSGQIVAFLMILSALRKWPMIASGVIWGVLGAFVFSSIWFLLTWFSLDEPGSYGWVWGFPNFVNIRFYASFLMVVAVISLWGAYIHSGRPQFIFYITFFLAMSQILWTGSRSPFISIVFLVAILALLLGRPFGRVLVRALFLTILSAIAAAQFPVESEQLGVERTLGLGGKSVVNTDTVDELSSGRLEIWKDAIHWIIQRPVMGWGGDYYREASPNSSVAQVHNGPLQLALEWGVPFSLVMFSIILILIFKGVIALRKGIEVTKGYLLGFFLLVSMFVHSLMDGVFYHGTPLFFVMVSLALVMSGVTGNRAGRQG